MPKVAYSEEDRERIRTELVAVGLELMAKQGIQHTTVEQIYKKVGICLLLRREKWHRCFND